MNLNTPVNNSNASPLPLADCLHRVSVTSVDEISGIPTAPSILYCDLASNFSGLPVDQCVVSEQACRVCMSRKTQPTETEPNDVVASMTITAIRKHAPERMADVSQAMRPYIATVAPTDQVRPQRVQMSDLPCVHRGEFIGVVACEMCGSKGVKIDVHECECPAFVDLPDEDRECTPGRWSLIPTKQPRRTCLGCNERREPESLIQIEMPRIAAGDRQPEEGGLPATDNPYLSIVMATHMDFDGVWFTVEILRSFFADVLAATNAEIVIVDTAPDTPHGKAVKSFIESWCSGDDSPGGSVDRVRGRYIPAGEKVGITGTAAPRDWGIRQARGEIVLCLDCHVIPQPGSLPSLVEYFRRPENAESIDLIHGPMLHDNFRVAATKMRPEWGSDLMFGKWDTAGDTSPDGKFVTQREPFEIPMHGMGLFAFRKAAWRGFNPNFSGFGGEEGYIHEKFRQAGGRVICLPELKWLHRFGRPGGVPYRLSIEDKFRNYLIGANELGVDQGEGISHAEVLRRFAGRIDAATYGRIVAEIANKGE